jgi:DNA-binding GntR family transcriptional regulator
MFADQLGISMTPVREAVRRLVAEGALQDTPSRTLVVPVLSKARMLEVKSARLSLEALVLDLAMDRMKPAMLDELEAILARPRARPDRPDPVRNHAFHFTLYSQSGSEVLLPMVEALWLHHGAYLNPVFRSERAGSVDEDLYHIKIFGALQRGDRAAAQAALHADISRSFDILLETVEDSL